MSGALPTPAAEWFRGAAACADSGAIAIFSDSRAVHLDPRASELLGLTSERALAFDEYLAALEPSVRGPCARQIDLALAAPGDAYHDEFRLTAKRWIAADGRCQHDRMSGRTVLVGLLSDVTLRRTTEDARSRLLDEMARALRFNDLLVGVVAHDLRNPLAAIAMSAELMTGRLRDPKLEVTASRITRSAERMARVVDQLLDLTHARLDGTVALRVAATDLGRLAREVAAELAAGSLPAGFAVDATGDTACVCDPDRVAQVVSNLLGNAVRHSPDAQSVRMTVDGTKPDHVSVTVTNPGTLAPELLPMLFNPFRRLRSNRASRDREHGLGLGLYIARRIALGHGGDVVYTSADEMTTFRVELPRIATGEAFSLTPERTEEEQMSLQQLASSDQPSQVTAAMFGVMPLEQSVPEAFATLVDRHARLLDLSLERQIYRDTRVNLATELRELAEQIGALGGGASDVAELHSQALKRATKGVPALKMQALVSEGRLIALELMGRLLTYYRKRSGFGLLTRARTEASP